MSEAAGSGRRVMETHILACLPERLHPVSRLFLESWLSGDMSTPEFLRWFHMPNSDYLPVAQCLLSALAAG